MKWKETQYFEEKLQNDSKQNKYANTYSPHKRNEHNTSN
jgi:hypothetical protein